MSKLRMWNDKHDDKTVVVQAAVLALLFHAIMLFLFYIPKDDFGTRIISNKRIRMLQSSSVVTGQSDLDAILYYGDPTVIAKPRHSYSIKESFKLRFIDDVILDKKILLYKPDVRRYAKLTHKATHISNSTTLLGSYPTLYSFTNSGTDTVYPAVKVDSRQFTHDFDFSLIGSNKDIYKNIPYKDSVFMVTIQEEGVLPRVVLLKSCGNTNFDQLGSMQLFRSYRSSNGSVDTKTVTITWRQPRGSK